MAQRVYDVIRRLGPLLTIKGLSGPSSTMNLKDYAYSDYSHLKVGDRIKVTRGPFEHVEKIETMDMAYSKPQWVELCKMDKES